MKKINKTRFAILGMLFKSAKSGYSILQLMQKSTVYFWQESDASIYPMLKKLEKEGKVTSKTESTGKRERTLFEITDAGKAEFLEWMELQPEPESHRNELLLKLFFGGTVARKTLIKQLQHRLQKVYATREGFRRVETDILASISNKDPYKLFGTLALKNGFFHTEAEIEWLTECIKILDKIKS